MPLSYVGGGTMRARGGALSRHIDEVTNMGQGPNRRQHRRRATGGQGGQGSYIFGGPGYAYGYPGTIVGTVAYGPIYGYYGAPHGWGGY